MQKPSFNPTETEEKHWLEEVKNKILAGLQEMHKLLEKQSDEIREMKAYMWDSRAEIDNAEKLSMRKSIVQTALMGENILTYKDQMSRLLESPWFGRIDFQVIGKNHPVPFYIGVHAFSDRTNNESLIHDWRAPVSGLFYDSETGPASFDTPGGEVKGLVTLKRQYKIRKGKMEFMLESAVRIHDEVLQQELSGSSGERMKNIVTTIQREQNAIIRNISSDHLIIQGVAGSGKTSIALHRIAYLLYRFKDSISSNEILIIAPNKVFSDYISNVLPELGEERIVDTSMEEIGLEQLENKYRYKSYAAQIAAMMETKDKGFPERIRFKSDTSFAKLMDEYLVYLENNLFTPTDIFFKRYPVPAWFVEEKFRSLHRLPLLKRIPAIVGEICSNIYFYYKYTLTGAEKSEITKRVTAMYTDTNLRSLYKTFYQWIGHPDLLKMTKGSVYEHADLFPMVYLKIRLEGFNPNVRIKHLVVDEMQDYTLLHYKVLSLLFPCNKTILGDIHQSLNPMGSANAQTIQKVLPRSEVITLTKSYRSTFEIARFALKFQPNTEMDIIERHGIPPQIWKVKTREEEVEKTGKLIEEFRKNGNQTLGVLFKTMTQAAQMHQAMPDKRDLHLLDASSTTFTGGIIFTTIPMAKGLEFDEVILPHADKYQLQADIDRQLLFVGITRAMHKLHLLHSGPFPIAE